MPISPANKRFIFFAGLIACACALAFWFFSHTPSAPGRDRLITSARAGGDYLLRMQGADGKFTYSYNPKKDRADEDDYNMLRHAGTAVALYQLYEATHDVRYLDGADKAVLFLNEFIRPIPEIQAAYVVDTDGKAKLGGAGLGLLALTYKIRLSPAEEDKKHAAQLTRFILSMQAPNGEFDSYLTLPDLPLEHKQSLYYPGEAMLALVRYYEITKDEAVLEAVKRGAARLIAIQMTAGELPPDAWFMQALEAAYAHTRNAAYAAHAISLAGAIIATQYGSAAPKEYRGGFGPDTPPRSTPASSRTEGLIAAYTLAKLTHEPHRQDIADAIYASLQFQLAHQYTGQNGLPEKAIGGIRASFKNATIRIDYVQHHISAALHAVEAGLAR